MPEKLFAAAPEPSTIRPVECLSTLFTRAFTVELASTPAQVDEIYALRYQVYCLEHPFEDPAEFPDAREHDAFDPRSVHALVRHRASGQCVGAVRLVLSGDDGRAAFPLEQHCGQALSPDVRATLAALSPRRVAEISRFAVSRDFRRRYGESATPTGLSDESTYCDMDGRRALPHITIGLFAAILRLSLDHGITHWLAVMEPTLLRLLKRFGITFPFIGASVNYHGVRQPTFSEVHGLVAGIGAARPDVWSFVTEDGRSVPPKPVATSLLRTIPDLEEDSLPPAAGSDAGTAS